MRAVTRHIEGVPEEWQSTNDWDSHRPLLWLAVNKCIGNVIEVGCGYGSTLLLQNYCKQNNQWFISLDNNKEWVDKFDATDYAEDLIGCACSYQPCAVLFIDFAPGELRENAISEMSNDADVIVVTAYGFIIPKTILEAKKYGCLNIHPSDLPKYRGAAPLQRTIINGENKTAVCIMQMDEGLDTGDIIIKEELAISNKITFTELHDKTSKIGARMLVHVLDNIDKVTPFKQSNKGVSYAHKLSKEESKINWYEPAFLIDCKVRGMNPWPGIYFEYQGKKIKIINEILLIDLAHSGH